MEQIFEASAMFGPANCWTGTSGDLSAMIRDLLREREALLKLLEHHQREAWRRGLISAGFGRHDIHRKEQT